MSINLVLAVCITYTLFGVGLFLWTILTEWDLFIDEIKRTHEKEKIPKSILGIAFTSMLVGLCLVWPITLLHVLNED